MARVLYTPSAETDLLDAWLFIAEEDPIAADRVLDTIDREANTLSSQPRMGRARPELGEGVRSWPTSTPYILFYTSEGEDLIVLRVLHHAREVQRFAIRSGWGSRLRIGPRAGLLPRDPHDPGAAPRREQIRPKGRPPTARSVRPGSSGAPPYNHRIGTA